MRRTALALLLVTLTASPVVASTFRCTWNQDCFYCLAGTKTDNCNTECSACWGIQCPNRAEEAGKTTSELIDEMITAVEPVEEPLWRFATEPLATTIDPGVARALGAFWNWYGQPFSRKTPLDLAGGVAIDGKPYETELKVRQAGERQLYALTIEGYAKVLLAVGPLTEQGQEVAFVLTREGVEAATEGHLRIPAER